MISILWTHSSNTKLRGWRPNHFVWCFLDVFDVSNSFASQHTSSTEEKEVTIPSSQLKTLVECDNRSSTSNKANNEPMDMADMLTTDKTDKNQVKPSPGVSSFYERLITHLSQILEVVEELTLMLTVLVVHLVFQYKRYLTLHTFLISIYNWGVIPMLTPFNFKTTESLDLYLLRNTIGKQFSHITKCHLLQTVCKLQVLWPSHQFINQVWRRN